MPLGLKLLFFGIFFQGWMGMAQEAPQSGPQPLREIRGESLEKVAGEIPEGVISDPAGYDKAWKALGLKESPGPVDFAHEMIFLSTTRGSRISLRLQDEGGGRLRAVAISTRDIRPGLRYLFGVFSKKDWTEINGARAP